MAISILIWMVVFAFTTWTVQGQPYRYAAVCPPASSSLENNTCRLHLLSPETDASVSIQTYNGTTERTLRQGEIFTWESDPDFIPTGGIECLAIRVLSNIPIQILVEKSDSFGYFFNDVYDVPEETTTNGTDFYEYYTSAYESAHSCSGSYYNQFLLVASFKDGTSIEVATNEGWTTTVDLPPFGTYLDVDGIFASGASIQSTPHPVSVISGNLCVINAAASDTDADTYLSSIRSAKTLGTVYPVPRIVAGTIGNYTKDTNTNDYIWTDTDVDTNTNDYIWTDTDVDTNTKDDTDTYVDTAVDIDTTIETGADMKTNANTDSNTLPDADTNTNTNTDTNVDTDDVYPGYSITVTAIENDTDVEFGDSKIYDLSPGESVTFERRYETAWDIVNCSKICSVFQFSKSVRNIAGNFMIQLLSLDDFYDSAYFVTPLLGVDSVLSIIVEGTEQPDLVLNGESLVARDWNSDLDGYRTIEINLAAGSYKLYSPSSSSFVAYVYSHSEFYQGGAGYAVQSVDANPPAVSTTPPVVSTTPSVVSTPPPIASTPAPSYVLPQFTVRLNGTARTGDGEAITPPCAQTHLRDLIEQNKVMLVRVNEAIIGKLICLNASSVVVPSASANMAIQGQQAFVDIRHFLRVGSEHSSADIEACSLEIGHYLADHTHWPSPIFPGVVDCSALNMDPDYFDVTGLSWNCNDQLIHEDTTTRLPGIQNALLFESTVSEVLTTADGSELSAACTLAYIDEAEKTTKAMMRELQASLEASSCRGTMTALTQTHGFITFGSQAFYQASFFYHIKEKDLTFGVLMENCALPSHAYIQSHDHWNQPGSPEFLPVPPGCPAMTHDGEKLDDEGYRWNCVDI